MKIFSIYIPAVIICMSWVLEFAPLLIITKKDTDEAVAVLDQCISEEEEEMGGFGS